MRFDDPRTFLWRNLCARVRGRRADGEPSINEVQAQVGVGRGTVQRIKEGDAATRLSSLYEIAESLGMPVWQLLIPPELQVSHLSDQALELARVFDSLPPHRQRQVFIAVQIAQNPDVDPAVLMPAQGAEGAPSATPTTAPSQQTQRRPAVSRRPPRA